MSVLTAPATTTDTLAALAGGDGLAGAINALDDGIATNITAIALNAAIASPTFTGTVTIPTLKLGSTTITSSGAELNILDGVTSTAAELNILDGVTADKDEINFLDGSTAGTAVASKAVVLNATKDFNFGTGDVSATDITATGDVITDEIKASTADTPVKFSNSTYQVPVAYTPAGAATAILDVSNSNIHSITMPAGNITIAISNETVGQCFLIEITQDGTGSRTVTWFSTIKWAGGSAPTLTTTASKRDTFGFRVTGADTYDAFIVGQNI